MPGTILYNLIALDPDLSNSNEANIITSLQYRIVSGNVANKFMLHPNRGHLSTNALLDREMQNSYQLVIEVSDSFYSSTCNVSIDLSDVNDNAPIFDKSDYYAILDLDSTYGWFTVLTVRAIDSDGDKLLYTIDTNTEKNQANSNLTRFFTINSETGEISIHRSLVGPIFDLVQSNQFSFEVIAIEASKSSYQSYRSRARVHITLVNDGRNTPIKLDPNGIKLAKYPYIIIADSQRESFRIGQEIGSIELNSLSTGAIGVNSKSSISYKFQVIHGGESYRSFNDYFHLNLESGVITVKRPLGYSYFEALVEVKQNDHLSKEHATSSQTLLQIFIGGIDDRKFVKPIHLNKISVLENQQAGSEIVNLASYISHSYGNHNHKFILAYSSLADYHYYFELDHNLGVLRLKHPLDYETQPCKIELIAIAYRPNGALHDEAFLYNITIDLVNVDDNRAQFTQGHYVGTIREGDPTCTIVAQVNAIDIDEVNTNVSAMLNSIEKRHSYFIVDGNEDNAFTVDVDGIVRTNIVLDREIHDRYRLKIIAADIKRQEELPNGWSADLFLSDEANYQHLSQCTLEVIVIDQNDNVPMFPPYRDVSVSENAPLGSVITTWTANDVDIFPMLSYSKRNLVSNTNTTVDDLFDIGLYTGKIVLKSSLKPLLKQQNTNVRTVQLSISASDQIHSVDADILINIKRNFSTMMPQFKKADGNFYLKLSLDSEHTQLLYDTNVEIFRVPVVEELQSRKVVFSLHNRSPDSNTEHIGFYIDQNLGIIYNNRTMRSVRSNKLYHLAVVTRYQDSDRASHASLLINVERLSIGYHHYKDSSVSSLSGTHNHYSLEIDSSQVGIPLLRLPKQQVENYVIVSGNTNKNFFILRGNELVLVSRPLTDQYSLKIKTIRSKATSKGINTTAIVQIKIRPSISVEGTNISPFKSSIFEIEISESEKVNSEIQSLKTITKTEKYEFAIFSGNEQNMFSIDPDSGTLLVAKQLDYEQTSIYRLGVLAKSRSESIYFAIVNINLLNTNEFCPRYPSSHFKAIIDENSPLGTKVIPIKAIDQDRDQLNYTVVKLTANIASDSADLMGPFRYDPESGYLVTTDQLDYEQQVDTHHHHQTQSPLIVYKFVVRVSDINGNHYALNTADLQCGSVETLLEVQIGSVDEFVPQFSSESYQFKVSTPTDAPVSPKSRLKIGQVVALDADQGPDGIVQYTIKSVTPAHLFDLLHINSTSGLITMSLTRMRKKFALKKNAIPKQFSLIVSASSGRVNSFNSLAMVDVQLSIVDHADGFIDITEDEDIEEINLIDSDLSRSDGGSRKESPMPGWLIFLTVIFLLLIVILLVTIIVVRMHQTQQQQLISSHFGGPNAANMGSLFRKIGPLVGSVGPNGINDNGISPAYSTAHYGTTSLSTGPPCYNDIALGQSNVLLPIHMEGHSASSGLGSAEDDEADLDDVDEEIRMINESSNYYTEGPESGGEEITTTAEYFARLGVSNHYEEEQENTSSIAIDDDDESTDVLSEMSVGKMNIRYGNNVMGTKKLRPRMGSSISTTGTIVNNNPSSSEHWPHGGSLNSIIQHNEEELSGSYNWDYLQHWGPKYQPLSSVFAEIAKLKSTDPPHPLQAEQSISAELLESMSNRSTTSTVSSRTRAFRQQQNCMQPPQTSQQQQAVSVSGSSPLSQHKQHKPLYYPQYSLQSQQTPSSLSNCYSIYGMATTNHHHHHHRSQTMIDNSGAVVMAQEQQQQSLTSDSSSASSVYNRAN